MYIAHYFILHALIEVSLQICYIALVGGCEQWYVIVAWLALLAQFLNFANGNDFYWLLIAIFILIYI